MWTVGGESWEEDTGKTDAKMSATEPMVQKMEEPTNAKQSSVIGSIGRSMEAYYSENFALMRHGVNSVLLLFKSLLRIQIF